MSRCQICLSDRVQVLIDLGSQALSNRYLTTPKDVEPLFSFVLSQCVDCGLIQIANPVSAADLRSRFGWITYNEQEGHLDELVDKICQLSSITKNSRFGATSFKDDSTIRRLQRHGFDVTWRLDPQEDLGITDPSAGLETLQNVLSPSAAEKIAARRGLADVLIVRHVVEHAHDLRRFLAALRKLVKPDGYVVIEVPDCTPALQSSDYTMFWEEHVCYFTPEILRWALSFLDFSLVDYSCYKYGNENSLVVIARPFGGQKSGLQHSESKAMLLKQGKEYAESLPVYRERVRRSLADFKQAQGKIAVFGAGHLSSAWINFLELGQYIEFVADDHPNKKGLFLPGARLPILDSTNLTELGIRLCLLTLNPDSERKVRQKNQAFIGRGGQFASIFPGKPNAFTPIYC